MKVKLILTVIEVAFVSILSASFDYNDKSKWVDPTDMIRDIPSQQKDKEAATKKPASHHATESVSEEKPESVQPCEALQKKLDECEKIALERPANEDGFFKQFVASLLNHIHELHLNDDEQDLCVVLRTSGPLLEPLQRFTKDKSTVQDAHSALLEMIQGLEPQTPSKPLVVEALEWLNEKAFTWLEQHAFSACLIVITMLALRVAIILPLPRHATLRSFLLKLLIASFLISIPWNWWHLYKREVALRFADSLKQAPPDCRPFHERGLWQQLTETLSVSDDACTRYHQRMMTDALWDVAPTQAVAVTFTKFAVDPLEHIGAALSKFIQRSLHGLPVYLWPVVLPVGVLVLLLLIVIGAGYRINLLGFFGLEPGGQNANLREIQLEEQNERLRDRLQRAEEEIDRKDQQVRDTKRELRLAVEESRETRLPLEAVASSLRSHIPPVRMSSLPVMQPPYPPPQTLGFEDYMDGSQLPASRSTGSIQPPPQGMPSQGGEGDKVRRSVSQPPVVSQPSYRCESLGAVALGSLQAQEVPRRSVASEQLRQAESQVDNIGICSTLAEETSTEINSENGSELSSRDTSEALATGDAGHATEPKVPILTDQAAAPPNTLLQDMPELERGAGSRLESMSFEVITKEDVGMESGDALGRPETLSPATE